MRSIKPLTPFYLILAAGLGLSACGGGGGSNQTTVPPRDLGPDEEETGETDETPTDEEEADEPVSISGVWHASNGLANFDQTVLIDDRGETALIYDCASGAKAEYQAEGEKVFLSPNYNSDLPGVRLRITGDELRPKFNSSFPKAQFLNAFSGGGHLDYKKVTDSGNSLSLASDGQAAGFESSDQVCGGVQQVGESSKISFVVPYQGNLLQLGMSFRGGASVNASNTIGALVSASVTSDAFVTELGTDKVVFSGGTIDFIDCNEDIVKGQYSLTSEQGIFSGTFSLANPEMNVCSEILVSDTEEGSEEDEVTSGAVCSEVQSPEGVTGVWEMDPAFLAQPLIAAFIKAVPIGDVNLGEFLGAGFVMSQSGSDVGVGFCEFNGMALLKREGDKLVGLESFDDVLDDAGQVAAINVIDEDKIQFSFPFKTIIADTLDVNALRIPVGGTNVCLDIEGLDPMPRSVVSCVGRSIAVAKEERNQYLTVSMVVDGDLYRAEIKVNDGIAPGEYDVADDNVSVLFQSASAAFIEAFGSNEVEIKEGTVTVLKKDGDFAKGVMDLVHTSAAGKKTAIKVDFFALSAQ